MSYSEAHSSIAKALELLVLLSGIRNYTRPEIMEKLDLSERSFYNYIRSLREAGFVVESKESYYTIPKNTQQYRELSNLLHFSEEESYILNQSIHNIDSDTKAKEQLISKLSALYDSDRIAVPFITKENSSKIHPILKSIKTKNQVLIKNYKSSGSGQISDRIVEAFEFTPNYISVWCFETSSKQNKLFKISRMQSVELLDKSWAHEQKHLSDLIDCFRVGGKDKIKIKMQLSLKAKNLLIEEYPLSEKFIITKSSNVYLFDGWVTKFDGIARFILGLPGEFKNIENTDLMNFLKEKIKIWNDENNI